MRRIAVGPTTACYRLDTKEVVSTRANVDSNGNVFVGKPFIYTTYPSVASDSTITAKYKWVISLVLLCILWWPKGRVSRHAILSADVGCRSFCRPTMSANIDGRQNNGPATLSTMTGRTCGATLISRVVRRCYWYRNFVRLSDCGWSTPTYITEWSL